MVMMYRFVFWFSTRFGSLVVAALTLMQSLSAFIACCLAIQNQDVLKKQLDTWLKTNEMMFMTGTLEDMRRDPETYLTVFIVYFTLHCLSGVLLIFGALKVVVWMVYPFLVLELARLLFLTVNFIIAMLLVKENMINLGLLITYCCGGGFILLFLYYLWFCTLSFVQIVKELEFVYTMGHYQGGRLNVEEYQRMNVPELGAEYYPRDQGYNMLHNNYMQQNYGREYFNDKFSTKFQAENDFANVLAKPVY